MRLWPVFVEGEHSYLTLDVSGSGHPGWESNAPWTKRLACPSCGTDAPSSQSATEIYSRRSIQTGAAPRPHGT